MKEYYMLPQINGPPGVTTIFDLLLALRFVHETNSSIPTVRTIFKLILALSSVHETNNNIPYTRGCDAAVNAEHGYCGVSVRCACMKLSASEAGSAYPEKNKDTKDNLSHVEPPLPC